MMIVRVYSGTIRTNKSMSIRVSSKVPLTIIRLQASAMEVAIASHKANGSKHIVSPLNTDVRMWGANLFEF